MRHHVRFESSFLSKSSETNLTFKRLLSSVYSVVHLKGEITIKTFPTIPTREWPPWMFTGSGTWLVLSHVNYGATPIGSVEGI